jgi:hypothetical protein
VPLLELCRNIPRLNVNFFVKLPPEINLKKPANSPILASSDDGEKKMAQKSVLRIRITLMRIRILILLFLAKLN